MNPEDQQKYSIQLEQVADEYKALVKGASFPCGTKKPKPMQKEREGSDIMRLDLQPAEPCLYSVGAGQHAMFAQDQGGVFVWHIGMFYPVNQRKSGGGTNLAAAISILAPLEGKGSGFFVVKPGEFLPTGYEWKYLNIFKRYYSKEHPEFSPKGIAQDLAWLVAETYERFCRLPKN